MLEAVYTGDLPYGRLVDLARVVLEAAEAGDRPSRSAVDQLVAEVVAMATVALERLDLVSRPAEVVVGGGLFENRRFFELVEEGVRAHAPTAELRPLAGSPPVLGAALLGLDALGAAPDAEVACSRRGSPPRVEDATANLPVGDPPWVGCAMRVARIVPRRVVAAGSQGT